MPSSAEYAEQIIVTIMPIMRELGHRLQAATPDNVTPAQFGLLLLLSREQLSLTDLARRWSVSAPTMSRMIHLLVEHGLVVREADPTDRRRRFLHPTPAGFVVQEHIRQAVRHSIADSLAELSDEQCAQILSALELFRQSLIEP